MSNIIISEGQTRVNYNDARQVRDTGEEIPTTRRLFYTKNRDKKIRLDDFFKEYPELVSLLTFVSAKLLNYFPDLNVYLEVRDDPETNETYLNVGIARHGRSVEEAQALLERFDNDWWLHYNGTGRLLLNITLEHGR